MYKELVILKYFFEDPTGEFHIRELGRLTKLNHMTVRAYLNKFVKQDLISRKKSKLYISYSANISNKKFLNLKLYYNLEKLRESKIIEDLESTYDYPVVVLFGSYATTTNTKDSDIDLFILTDIQKYFSLEKYEKVLNRKVSIHKFTEKEFQNIKIKNPELLNNIINGIGLSGKLEVF